MGASGWVGGGLGSTKVGRHLRVLSKPLSICRATHLSYARPQSLNSSKAISKGMCRIMTDFEGGSRGGEGNER